MTDAEGRWSPHPDAVDNRVDLSPVAPGSIVGLGAICDLRPQRDGDPSAQDFSVSEFVTLDDGRRVILHKDRGFSLRLRSTGDLPAADDVTLRWWSPQASLPACVLSNRYLRSTERVPAGTLSTVS